MFCPRCVQEHDEQAKFCQGCGTSLQNLSQESRSMETTIAVQYAGFWRRFVAAFIDVILIHLFLITIVVVFALSRFIGPIFMLALRVITWIYSGAMESSSMAWSIPRWDM